MQESATEHAQFRDAFDCVVMLSGSNWDSVPETRFHHARLLANLRPLFFVQPDLAEQECRFESTDTPGVELAHVWREFGQLQGDLLAAAIRERGFFRPLIWTTDVRYHAILRLFAAPLKIYSADAADVDREDGEWVAGVRYTLDCTDILVAPSEEVREQHARAGSYTGRSVVVSEGRRALRALLQRIVDPATRRQESTKLSVLVLYDDRSTHVATTREHLESFSEYSKHDVSFVIATNDAVYSCSIEHFDVVIVHYTVRLRFTWHLAAGFADALANYDGYTVLFIQDEYEHTETARNWIEKLNVDLVFTCVPDEFREAVYPTERFPGVEFIQNLTGYVPTRLEGSTGIKPLAERTNVIGYRGRPLPYWYGTLGQEKLRIGVEMRRLCEERGVAVDIEWDESKRIYGPDWYEWLQTSRATLGTESGANVFDDYGEIESAIRTALEAKPELRFEDVFEKHIAPHEGRVRMNQISPRVFESIAARTALILFEGNYSGIIQPDVHFIPLKKDFSNIDKVLATVQDDERVSRMVERAYSDVIESGAWSYRTFVRRVDDALDARVKPARSHRRFAVRIGSVGLLSDSVQLDVASREVLLRDMVSNRVLAPNDLALPLSIAPLAPEPVVVTPTPSQDDPVALLKTAVAQRLQGRPWLLKPLVFGWSLLRRVYLGIEWLRHGLRRAFRNSRTG